MAERPDDIYHALLTAILRLVFLLYAEERDLLPDSETFVRHYSLAGLHEDAALHPDTMNQRYGPKPGSAGGTMQRERGRNQQACLHHKPLFFNRLYGPRRVHRAVPRRRGLRGRRQAASARAGRSEGHVWRGSESGAAGIERGCQVESACGGEKKAMVRDCHARWPVRCGVYTPNWRR